MSRFAALCILSTIGLSLVADTVSLDFVNPLIGTREIPGLEANYGGMEPMVGVPFGSMHLVPMTRTNGVARVLFAADDKDLLGFALTRQPAIWMGEWGKVEIRLRKPLAIESIEAKPHYAKVRAGGHDYELVASSHVVYIRTEDDTLGEDLAESGWTSERTIRTGADPKPNFRCDWIKKKADGVLKVAVSLLGANQANDNFSELPEDFDDAVRQVKAEWEKYFARVTIDAPKDVKTIFYTGLYHALLYPREMTEGGRHYSGIDDKVHDGVGYDCYSLWDTYRAEHPLLTLIAPDRVDGMMQTLVNTYRRGGWLPIWQNLGYTGQMVGGPAEVVLAEAIVKGFRGFDVEGAWEAVKKNATVPQIGDLDYRWPGLRENRAGPPETRGGLTRYMKNGYVSDEETDESVSRTLDYAYDDFCVANMAHALGKEKDAAFFAARSKSYTNLWNASARTFLPRAVDGSWMKPEPVWRIYTETTPKTARWCVPHDVEGLAMLMGGGDAFVRELDRYFAEDFYLKDSIGRSVHGNEPSHHIAYMYNRVGAYHKTCKRVREILTRCYSTDLHGFDGNEDCGQMSAWYILSALGFYPLDPASGIYELGSPLVRSAVLRFGAPYKPSELRIAVKNYAPDRWCVRRVTFNGRERSERFVTHADLVKGGELVFEMEDWPETKLELGSPFGDGMVLQRDRAVPVWGWAEAGEKIAVSFAGRSVTTIAAQDGSWRVNLPSMSACSQGRTMTVSSDSASVAIDDVLVGDVWLIAGQSNVDVPLVGPNTHYSDADGGMTAQLTRKPKLRYVIASNGCMSTDPRKRSASPLEWKPFVSENLGTGRSFSAIGVYFALQLHDAIAVPVGVVGVYNGGTRIEPWIPNCGFQTRPEFAAYANWRLQSRTEFELTGGLKPLMPMAGKTSRAHYQPSAIWNFQLEPLVPFAVRGLLWYQGCSNRDSPEWYSGLMHALYDGWRTKFENQDMNLYFVQLAADEESTVPIWKEQAKFAREEPKSAMVVINDLVNEHDVHPNQKRLVGERLAARVLKRDYGFDIKDSSPTLRTWKLDGNRFVLSFDDVDVWRFYRHDWSVETGFEIAGEDGVFKPAYIGNMDTGARKGIPYRTNGTIEGRNLIVLSDEVKEPKKLRYLHGQLRKGCLYNEVDLPLGWFEIEAKEDK